MKQLLTLILTEVLLIAFFNYSVKAQNTFPSSGNVGIGTSNPTYPHDVYGGWAFRNTGYFYGTAYAYESSTGQYLHFRTSGGKGYVGMNSSNDIVLQSNGGKVGIGAASPTAQLQIKSTSGYEIKFSGQDEGNIIGSRNLFILAKKSLYFGSEEQEGQMALVDGELGIGTTSPDAKLTVKGDIHAEEVIVDLAVPGPDYVFEEDYELTTLEETESYIKAHKHLPEIPSAKEMEEEGIDLGTMNMMLLKKIEELTLHVITMKNENQDLRVRVENLELVESKNTNDR